jgi:hypothetical protein
VTYYTDLICSCVSFDHVPSKTFETYCVHLDCFMNMCESSIAVGELSWLGNRAKLLWRAAKVV